MSWQGAVGKNEGCRGRPNRLWLIKNLFPEQWTTVNDFWSCHAKWVRHLHLHFILRSPSTHHCFVDTAGDAMCMDCRMPNWIPSWFFWRWPQSVTLWHPVTPKPVSFQKVVSQSTPWRSLPKPHLTPRFARDACVLVCCHMDVINPVCIGSIWVMWV